MNCMWYFFFVQHFFGPINLVPLGEFKLANARLGTREPPNNIPSILLSMWCCTYWSCLSILGLRAFYNELPGARDASTTYVQGLWLA